MRWIAHISDLHFGKEDPAIVSALLAELGGDGLPAPALVAVSGDLTQRARPSEFRACRSFLDRLSSPYLVVPGNHDVPFYDVTERLLRPLARYRKYISDDLMPVFCDDVITVAGVDTAHGLTLKDGRITRRQVANVCRKLRARSRAWAILVTHHPFVVPHHADPGDRVDGAKRALPALEDCVDVVLSGHLHVPHSSQADAGFRTDDRRLVSVHAGTCVSTRLRGEPNGYNRLGFEGDTLCLVHRVWDGRRFVDGPTKEYRRRGRDRSDATFLRVE